MKYPHLWFLLGLSLVSCDKAKEVATKAQEVVIERVEDARGESGKPAETADQSLAVLVDKNEQGYLFRKDLAFPENLSVKTTSEFHFKGRLSYSSLLGKGSENVEGSFTQETVSEKKWNKASIKLGDNMFLADIAKTSGNPKSQEKLISKGAAGDFEWKGGKWALVGNDFAAMAVFNDKNIGNELAINGIMPRPYWLGKKRLNPGEELALSGDHLGMLGYSGCKGTLRLKFESVEPVVGHPCGVFSVAGDIDGKVGWVGDGGKVQLTIESGKIWISLIHPLILKEDLSVIVTSKSKLGTKQSDFMQGAGELKIQRDWTILPATGS